MHSPHYCVYDSADFVSVHLTHTSKSDVHAHAYMHDSTNHTRAYVHTCTIAYICVYIKSRVLPE